jgi:hypothetical protein
MLCASIFALILQCGITVAAAIIVIFTPTVGVGCRSLGYIIYGGIAIVIMFLTIISTISARISETREKRSAITKSLTAFIAVALRWVSSLLALVNGMGLIVLSCFQFSHLLDNCYCNASVISRGMDSYVVIFYDGPVSAMMNSRIVATILAAACTTTYMIFLRIMSASPERVDYF